MANPLEQLFPHSLKHVSWRGRTQPNIATDQRPAGHQAQIIVPSAASNTFSLLDRDRDAFRQLTLFLSLRQLGQLASCSTRIRRWFTHDGLSTLRLSVQLRDSDLESLSQCAWARRRIANVQLIPDARRFAPPALVSHAARLLRPTLGVALLSCLPWTAAKLWLHQADRLWATYIRFIMHRRLAQSTSSAMLHLSQLEHLQYLSWMVALGLDAPALSACFSTMGASLQTLIVTIAPTPHAIETRATIMSCIAGLRSLHTLEIIPADESAALLDRRLAAPFFASAQRVDFSGLPQLKALTAFRFAVVEQSFFRASAEQCACLARCDALTWLDCGLWDTPAAGSLDELGQPFVVESEDAFLTQRIGVLAARKGRTIFEEAAVGAMDQEPQQVRVHALTHLRTHCSEHVTPLLWSHLTQFTALRELLPRSWSDEIGAAEWNKLSDFTQLQRVLIGGPALLLDHVWPPLLSCSALTEVIFCDNYCDVDKMLSMLDALPKLVDLQFAGAAVPSLAPLHNSVLIRLTLWGMVDAHGRPVCARRMLTGVALPRLEYLNIKDDDGARLLPAEAAELNRPIFESCPLLRPSNFEQNLR